jgi:hypothetical protein
VPEQPNGIELFISALPSLMLFQVATRVEGAIDLQSGFGRCRAYQLDYGKASGERTAALVLRDNKSNHLSNYDGRDGSFPLRRGRQYKFDISASAPTCPEQPMDSALLVLYTCRAGCFRKVL